jgi:hypothetical protein
MKDIEKIELIDEEKKLLIKYLNEYNEIFERILKLSQNEFISNVRKRVEIELKDKINNYSSVEKRKIEKYVIENYYLPDLKLALIIKKHIINQTNKDKDKFFSEEEIIPHCEYDKNNNYYIHSCGEKFYYFKYKVSKKNNFYFRKSYDYFLYCLKCDNIYKSSMIRLKCYGSGEIFYSKLLNNNNNDFNNNKELCYATWKKYHCNAVINDIMKCQNCNYNLLYDKDNNTLICSHCNKEYNPSDIKFTCLICKNEFRSEAKIYNPLEYKLLKISIKDALIKKEKAFPKYMGCKCDIDAQNSTFFHKNSCRGILYLGEMNDEKIVVCSYCNSIGIYDEFIWTCPECLKRFQIKKKMINKRSNYNDKYYDNNILSLTDSWNNENILKLMKSDYFTKKNNINQNHNNRNNSNRRLKYSVNSEIKPKIKIVLNNKEFDYNNSINSKRIKVKKRLFTNIKNKNDIIPNRNISFNISLNINKEKEKERDNNNVNDNEKIKKSIRDKLVSLYTKKNVKFKRPKNSLTSLNSRDNSLKNKIRIIRENTLTNNNLTEIDTTESLDYKSRFNNFLYNLNLNKYNDYSKDINKGKIMNIINIKATSLNNSIDKYYYGIRSNKISNYMKMKNKMRKQNENNLELVDKEKEENLKCKNNIFIKKLKNKLKHNSFKSIDKIGNLRSTENLNKSTQINKIKDNYISSLKEYTKINILNKKEDKINNISTNLCNVNDTSIEIEQKPHKNKGIQEKIININKCSDSTAYESEQNSKITSVKMSPLLCSNNKFNDSNEYNNISEYKIIKQIGRGTFGQIFMVEKEKSEYYALKKLIGCSMQEIHILEREYQILFELNSSEETLDLVKIYKIETKQLDPTTFVMYVLMELAQTDWEKEILNKKNTLNYYREEELMNIMFSLIKTFAYLQKKNISHRDIKPQNILVFKDNKYKLADFGEAKELIDENKITEGRTLRGTELYMSPILFNALKSRQIKKYIKHNTYKSDVFSFGLCLLFAATLCFESLYEIRELKSNENIKIAVEKNLKERYSKHLINMIVNMLDINENTRSDFIDLEQKFFNFRKKDI